MIDKNLWGVVGSMCSGKDTLTYYLRYLKEFPDATFEDYQKSHEKFWVPRFEIRKYADKLKDIVCLMISCTRKDLEDQTFKATPIPGWERYKVVVVTQFGDKILYFSDLKSIYKEQDVNGKLYNARIKKPIHELITPRMLMQIIGSSAGRDLIHPDIWCKALFSEYKPTPKLDGYSRSVKNEVGQVIDFEQEVEYPKWIISDVRYPTNETEYIREHDGVVIGIRRRFGLRFPEYAHLEDELFPYKVPFTLNSEDPELYEALTFESETVMGDLEWTDYLITNDGTLEELFLEVKKMLTIL